MGKRLGADERTIELLHALGAWRSARKHAAHVKSVDSAIDLQYTTRKLREAVKAHMTLIEGGRRENA